MNIQVEPLGTGVILTFEREDGDTYVALTTEDASFLFDALGEYLMEENAE